MRALTAIAAWVGFALALAAPAVAGKDVSLLVVPHLDLARYASAGAVGLLVPGAGATVTGAGALAGLERGRVASSLLGGVPSGPVLVRPSRRPAAIMVYVSLPGPGRHENDRRYPIAVVGDGFHGVLTSRNTRIRGLVSIADVAPAVVALRNGGATVIGWQRTRSALPRLRALDLRLVRAHDARQWANVVLVALAGGFGLLSLLGRSPLLARAALLAIPASLLAALALSALRVTTPSLVAVALLLLGGGAGAIGTALLCRSRRRLAAALLAVFPIELVVLALSPETNALAVIGPHPDGGGRFYGITNQVETLLLVPALLGAALLGRRRLAPVTLLALLTVGGARTGADGGGGIVLATAFLFLGLRLYGVRLTVPRLGAIAAAAALLMVGFVGLDAAAGGSSHVSRALGGGPAALGSLVLNRLHVTGAGAVASTGAIVLFLLGVGGLACLALQRSRSPVLEALLVGIAVSLVVNDSPADIAFYGAISGAVLWAWTVRGEPQALAERG